MGERALHVPLPEHGLLLYDAEGCGAGGYAEAVAGVAERDGRGVLVSFNFLEEGGLEGCVLRRGFGRRCSGRVCRVEGEWFDLG